MDGSDDFHKSLPVLTKFNSLLSSLVFALDDHRKNLLPVEMEKSLCDEQIASRCPYGYHLVIIEKVNKPIPMVTTRC